MSDKVTLIPVAMVRPTEESIYAPSTLRPAIEVDEAECTQVQNILVSFAADGKSDPALIPSYTRSSVNAEGVTDLKSFGRFIKR